MLMRLSQTRYNSRRMTKIMICRLACLITIFSLAPQLSWSCSCAGSPTVQEAKDRSTAVFTGTPIAIVFRNYEENVAGQIVYFQVDRSWKGDLRPAIRLGTGMGGADCGLPFKIGTRYLVYASGDGQNYAAHLCSRTGKTETATEDLKELGPGQKMSPLLNVDSFHSFVTKQLTHHPQDSGVLNLEAMQRWLADFEEMYKPSADRYPERIEDNNILRSDPFNGGALRNMYFAVRGASLDRRIDVATKNKLKSLQRTLVKHMVSLYPLAELYFAELQQR